MYFATAIKTTQKAEVRNGGYDVIHEVTRLKFKETQP